MGKFYYHYNYLALEYQPNIIFTEARFFGIVFDYAQT